MSRAVAVTCMAYQPFDSPVIVLKMILTNGLVRNTREYGTKQSMARIDGAKQLAGRLPPQAVAMPISGYNIKLLIIGGILSAKCS